MRASDSWRRARDRLETALEWSSGRDDHADRGWDDEGIDREDHDDEPALRLVPALRREICAVAVATYEDAQRVADAFRRDTPVMVNLQGCETEVARRVVDFCSGLSYARDGRLCAIAEDLFLLAPAHVELCGDERRGLAGSGFYNRA